MVTPKRVAFWGLESATLPRLGSRVRVSFSAQKSKRRPNFMVRQPLVYIANKNTARSGASSIVVTVGTSPPGQGEDRRTDHGSTDQRRKRRIPTGPLYEQPEAPTRNDRASVAEQPRRADSAGCSATEARSFRVGASGCSYSGPVGMRRFRR